MAVRASLECGRFCDNRQHILLIEDDPSPPRFCSRSGGKGANVIEAQGGERSSQPPARTQVDWASRCEHAAWRLETGRPFEADGCPHHRDFRARFRPGRVKPSMRARTIFVSNLQHRSLMADPRCAAPYGFATDTPRGTFRRRIWKWIDERRVIATGRPGAADADGIRHPSLLVGRPTNRSAPAYLQRSGG